MAKKTGLNNYEYRGFIIEKSDSGVWVIGKGSPSCFEALDAMNTKRDAKAKIDFWLR